MIWICILKPLPISSYQEKVAKARHANDQRGVDFCKGKHILLTSDLIPLSISSCQEKMATTRHTSDLREGGGCGFYKLGKYVLLTRDLNMDVETLTHF